MVTVVHASRRYMLNAFWNGDKVFIGNGDCDQYGPLTTLDVIGHEFTHGVIDYTSNLVYQDEYGALNESLADIFGKALEYKYDNENFNWLIGNKFQTADLDNGFRDMSDPNTKNDPKFYLGEDWHTSTSDRGGVHTNSGVFNYWFYLLVEGESGTNEVGYNYDVQALGIDDAMQIVFGSMSGYFSENTNYPDAMRLTLEQTIDLYGENSQQYESVLEAWLTVGLYPGFDDLDWALEFVEDDYSGCPDTEIIPSVIVRNKGTQVQPAGTVLELSYIYDSGLQEVAEDFTLTEDVMPGDSIYYTFQSAVVYEEDLGDDLIFNLYNEENIQQNNLLIADLEFADILGSDLELRDFEFRIDDFCNPTSAFGYRLQMRNEGCEPITSEDEVTLKITTDLEEVEITFDIFSDISPGSTVFTTRNFLEDMQAGFTNYRAELIFDRDADDASNVFEGTIDNTEGIEDGYLEEFNESDYRDQLSINTSSFSARDSVIEYRDTKMFAISRIGSNTTVEKCSLVEDVFNENSKQSTIDVCLDARGMEEPVFAMNIAQIRNGMDDELPEEFRTIVKLGYDGMDFPLIYNQPNGEIVYHEFPLPLEYIGPFSIEVFTYSRERDAFEPVGLDSLDAVLFDNIQLFDKANQVIPPVITEYSVNPTLVSDIIEVVSPDSEVEYEFLVFDVIGRKIYQVSQYGSTTVGFSDAPPGTYFYLIKEGTAVIESGKLLKVE